MKLNQLLLVFAIFGLAVFISCEAGGGGAEGDAADTTAMEGDTMDEDMDADKMVKEMDMEGIYIIHDVNDYKTWKPKFDAHESDRMEAGLEVHWVARQADKPNTVHVAMGAEDIDAAREFAASDDLKMVMKDAGVKGEPNVRFFQLMDVDPTDEAGMERLAIVHKVKDYDSWKEVYDDHEDAREEAGLEQRAIARNLDNPNEVFLMFSYEDKARAEKFSKSEDLKMKMEEAGVTGEPEIYWLNITDLRVME